MLHVQPSYSGLIAFLSFIGGSDGAVLGGYVGDRFGYVLPSVLSALSLAVIVGSIPKVGVVGLVIALMLLLGFLYGFYAAPSKPFLSSRGVLVRRVGSLTSWASWVVP